MHVHFFACINICVCHQMGRIVTQQNAQHKLYSLVLGFPSTAQLPGSLFLDFGSCVLPGKPATLPGLVFH